MKKPLLITLIFLFYLTCFAEENTYSIYMMGNKIGKSTDRWMENKDEKGNRILTLDSSSDMEISRGSSSIILKSHSVVRADCKNFAPIDIKTESSELSSTLKASGTVENDIFKASIEKNGNRENFSYHLNGATFFSLIFKKFSSKELLKGGKAEVISEDTLSLKEISYSAVRESSGNLKVTVDYGGVPIIFILSGDTVIRSELQNGLISYVLDGHESVGNPPVLQQTGNGDIITSTAIENKGAAIKYPRKTAKVSFTFTGKNGAVIPAVPETCFQHLKEIKDGLVVTNTSLLQCAGSAPEKLDTLPNLYEDSNNQQIIDTAKRVAKGAQNSDEIIKRMVKFVFRHVKDKNYKYGDLSASEVLKNQSGDCTEHSTLLAALLRSLGIPVKMAYGIVLDDGGRFFFHNWNVAYNGREWVSVDSTFGMEKADSSRVVLIFGSGTSQSREDVSLTVLKFMSNIEISVTGFEYGK